jgi:hypothetical protein
MQSSNHDFLSVLVLCTQVDDCDVTLSVYSVYSVLVNVYS